MSESEENKLLEPKYIPGGNCHPGGPARINEREPYIHFAGG